MPKKFAVEWTSEPNNVAKIPHVELVRCPPNGTPPYLITADKLIGTQVYWMHGRTCPHIPTTDEQKAAGMPNQCPGCVAEKAHRWTGWLSVWDERKLQHCILEVTPNTVGQINDWLTMYGTLRGSRIVLERKSKRPNGAMTAKLAVSGLPLAAIPLAFDLVQQLELLWDAPSKSEKAKLESPRTVAESAAMKELEKAKLSKTYEATPEQLEMMEQHRKQKLADHQARQKKEAEDHPEIKTRKEDLQKAIEETRKKIAKEAATKPHRTNGKARK